MASIRVADGTLVDPYNPKIEDIKLDVFAHALSQINRFTGHAMFPYPVAQHTMNLCGAMRRLYRMTAGNLGWRMQQVALAHDMSETWFNDLASPVKRENPDYKKAEHFAGLFIMGHLGIRLDDIESFDEFDKRIYKNERNALFPVITDLGMGDDRKPLRPEWLGHTDFEERSWRDNRQYLWWNYQHYFPAFCPSVPFWEKKEFKWLKPRQ